MRLSYLCLIGTNTDVATLCEYLFVSKILNGLSVVGIGRYIVHLKSKDGQDTIFTIKYSM